MRLASAPVAQFAVTGGFAKAPDASSSNAGRKADVVQVAAVVVAVLRDPGQCPKWTSPPSVIFRSVSASGTVASEISISTQKASM